MLTNTFEYSLQKVNPKLTVPYWDFTIEKSTFGGNTPETIEPQANSPLLSPDWFGTQNSGDAMVCCDSCGELIATGALFVF